MRQRTRNEVRKLVYEAIEEYTFTEAKKVVEQREAKRDKRIADLISALSVIPEQTPVRATLEAELGMILSSGPLPSILSEKDVEKMVQEGKNDHKGGREGKDLRYL